MLLEGRAVSCERTEHEAAIGLHPRHAAERKLRLVLAFITLGKRVADQPSVVGEGPGMERAGERTRIAFVVGTDLVAAMRTAVEQQVDLPLLVPGHDHRLRA